MYNKIIDLVTSKDAFAFSKEEGVAFISDLLDLCISAGADVSEVARKLEATYKDYEITLSNY